HVWQDRVAAADRERAPRVVNEDGASVWVYEDYRRTIPSLLVQAGTPRDQITPGLASYEEMRPGFYDSVARIADMDEDGVLASLCFPMLPRYCGQTFMEAKDRKLGLECLRAYNNWMIEEWCGLAPGRFIPLIIIPLWDPPLAAQEIERTAAMGAKAIAFSENPTKLGLPSLHDANNYWDPVLAAANDTAMPLCIHIGSSSTIPTTSDDAPIFVSSLLSPLNLAFSVADWLFCGKLDRYPTLKICLSEGGIGWIPFVTERADYITDTLEWAFRFDADGTPLADRSARVADRPSELFRRHIYGCFIDDAFGARHLADIGFDNAMIETDYPHGDGTFPNSIANAHTLLAGYSDDVKYKVMQGNARRVFAFEPAEPPVSATTSRSGQPEA
ncbi:MAG: amidohydrolase, partial [Actinobacteria bacterium]